LIDVGTGCPSQYIPERDSIDIGIANEDAVFPDAGVKRQIKSLLNVLVYSI
jgi:hypothetical protein